MDITTSYGKLALIKNIYFPVYKDTFFDCFFSLFLFFFLVLVSFFYSIPFCPPLFYFFLSI